MNPKIAKLANMGLVIAQDDIEDSVWQQWAEQLAHELEVPQKSTLVVGNPERKWELVSAYQKSVRRGDTELALRLVSAMESMTQERQYMWRRICTTSTEDVGLGSPLVMKFVVACSIVWTPSQCDQQTALALWGFLTKLMCETSRSHVYCQYSVLYSAMRNKDQVFTFTPVDDDPIEVKALLVLAQDLQDLSNGSQHDLWLLANNWRGEGMVVGPLWDRQIRPTLMHTVRIRPEHRTLAGLPAYAYDMHTQMGKATCVRACGLPEMKSLFQEMSPTNKADAIGYALFYVEGGQIIDGWYSPEILNLEMQYAAQKLGLTIGQWYDVVSSVRKIVWSGEFDDLREKVLIQRGY